MAFHLKDALILVVAEGAKTYWKIIQVPEKGHTFHCWLHEEFTGVYVCQILQLVAI